jgi:hypothetical protein
MSTTLEPSAPPEPSEEIAPAWAFLSLALLIIAVLVPIPVPLVAFLGMACGFLGARKARRDPRFRVEKWMGRVGFWGALVVLVLTLLTEKTSSFG